MKKYLTPIFALALGSLQPASAAITAQFEFNEANGSGASAATDVISGTAAYNDFTGTGSALHDGAGSLVFTGNVGQQNLATGAIFGGSAFFRLDFSSWNTSGGGNDFEFALRLRDTDTGGVGNVTAKVKIYGSTNDSNRIELNSINGGAFIGAAFGQASIDSDGFSLILEYDLANSTWSTWYDATRNGSYVADPADQALVISDKTPIDGWEQVNAITLDTSGGSAADFYALDFLAVGDDFTEISGLTPAPVPEPSTFALLAGVLALGRVMLRRR